MSVDVHQGDKEGLDRERRYLRPVGRLRLPEEPDLVHLSVYEWLDSFQAWATGLALCGRSTSQGPLPEGTEVTCASCLAYEPKYQVALDLQVGMSRCSPEPAPALSVQETLLKQVRDAVRAAGMTQPVMAQELHVSRGHLSRLMSGEKRMSMVWAERILALCGMELVVTVRPQGGGR